jgi:hypothetical protein
MSFWRRIFRTNTPLGIKPEEASSKLQAVFQDEIKQQEVVKWVESGGNINWTDPYGMTLLHYAAMKDNETMVRFLLQHGASVNASTKYGATPLIWACANIAAKVVPILLEYGANPNATDNNGAKPLQLIRQSSLPEAKKTAEVLINSGAELIPGVTCLCPECGAPETALMRERGVNVTINGVFAGFSCTGCNKFQEVSVEMIDHRGIAVLCRSCNTASVIPASVWCKTCGKGLSSGWQEKVRKV